MGSDQLVDDGGDATQPDGDLLDMKKTSSLWTTMTQTTSTILCTQAGSSRRVALQQWLFKRRKVMRFNPTDCVNSTVHKDGKFQGVGSSTWTLGAVEGEEDHPDGDLLDMHNIISLDHDDTYNVNDLVHTSGKLQEGGSSHKWLLKRRKVMRFNPTATCLIPRIQS